MERVAPVCTVPRQNRGAALATKLVFFLRRAIGGDASACERILDPGRGVAISKTAARALQCRFNYLELSPGMRRRIASMPHGRELLVSQVRTALVPTRGFSSRTLIVSASSSRSYQRPNGFHPSAITWISTLPRGRSGTRAVPSRLVFTFISIFLSLARVRGRSYLTYTLAPSIARPSGPPVTSMRNLVLPLALSAFSLKGGGVDCPVAAAGNNNARAAARVEISAIRFTMLVLEARILLSSLWRMLCYSALPQPRPRDRFLPVALVQQLFQMCADVVMLRGCDHILIARRQQCLDGALRGRNPPLCHQMPREGFGDAPCAALFPLFHPFKKVQESDRVVTARVMILQAEA